MHVAVINKCRYPAEPAPAVAIGRPSPLGNPFKMSKATGCEEMVAYYAAWLDAQRAQPDSAVARGLARLRLIPEECGELTLVCWCAPLPCHGDAIRERLLGPAWPTIAPPSRPPERRALVAYARRGRGIHATPLARPVPGELDGRRTVRCATGRYAVGRTG